MTDLRGYTIVLGTASKWRRALFAQHFPDVNFTLASADIDEDAAGGARAGADAHKLTSVIAAAKADALSPQLRGTRVLLVTLDQVVVVDGAIREKPNDRAQAREYLRSYARHPVRTVTAVVVEDCISGRRVCDVDEAALTLRPLPEDVIESLLDKGDVLHSAGGITVEDKLVAPFHAGLDGELISILGLPVTCVKRLLRNIVAMSDAKK